jgi:hypothetical protein
LLALVAAYLVVAPLLNARWGWKLPGWRELAEQAAPLPSPTAEPQAAPLPSRPATGPATESRPAAGRSASEEPAGETRARLRAIADGSSLATYESPAGLVYSRGSQHGHRLRHILAHAVDQPDRPGSHGVFSTQDPAELVRWIDEAYLLGQRGERTRLEREGDREVYTVDLGRTVGFVGGEQGNRSGRPATRRLRLVLDDRRVITAFPVR